MAITRKEVCGHCGIRFALTPDNAFVFVFEKNHSCDHMIALCSSCGKPTITYVTATDIRWLAGLRLEVHYSEQADKDLQARAKAAWEVYRETRNASKKFAKTFSSVSDEELWKQIKSF